jgi:hypothetical protein
MCTVLLPPGGYPNAVNKYIISNQKIAMAILRAKSTLIRKLKRKSLMAYSGRRSITPSILNSALDRGERLTSGHWSLYPPGKEARTTLNRRLSGAQCRSECFEEAKKSTARTGNRNPDRLAHSPVIVLTTSNTGH